ncbi:MAG: plasmid stabilization protein [Betaproteobacteria bacterium RIFCSPLOWO2_12_FULL_65_14]|nr:MAG: plasmid stabilization protein [Betaproteobacteria bacterium RIFCSPLOWO2_12_FULL_65_14]
MLAEITDRRIRGKVAESIDALKENPGQIGKPLVGDLAAYRSLRAAGQRYRIIYRIEKLRVVVFVVAVGIRKEGDKRDIVALAKKLLKLGLIKGT